MRQSVDRRLDLQFDNLWILPVRVLLSEALLSFHIPVQQNHLDLNPMGLASMQAGRLYAGPYPGVIVPVLPFVWPSGYGPHRTSQKHIAYSRALSSILLEGAQWEGDRTHKSYPVEPSNCN